MNERKRNILVLVYVLVIIPGVHMGSKKESHVCEYWLPSNIEAENITVGDVSDLKEGMSFYDLDRNNEEFNSFKLDSLKLYAHLSSHYPERDNIKIFYMAFTGSRCFSSYYDFNDPGPSFRILRTDSQIKDHQIGRITVLYGPNWSTIIITLAFLFVIFLELWG